MSALSFNSGGNLLVAMAGDCDHTITVFDWRTGTKARRETPQRHPPPPRETRPRLLGFVSFHYALRHQGPPRLTRL